MRPGVPGFSEQQSSAVAPSGSQAKKVDVAVVGSGFAGLCMGAHLKLAGRNSFVIIEKGDDVGGTWRDNRYPGCACDVPSHLYSLSFASKADWSRLYPSQPELFGYLRDVAKSYGLRPHIRFNTAMKRAEWSEPDSFWRVTVSSGDVIAARVLVSCIGALHAPAYPSLPGIDRFRGTTFHSAKWPVDCDLRGRRVAVVGAGASAIQFVPQIAPEVEKLRIFQRAAPWVLPKGDRPIGRWERLLLGHLPGYNRAFRKWLHWRHELRLIGFLGNDWIVRKFEDRGRRHIARYIDDPDLRKAVTPNYRMGCKRVLISDDYYPALARSNVEVVTDRIAELRAGGILTADGIERAVDTIIYGTGFDFVDSLRKLDVTGRNGVALATAWRDAIQSYHGIAVSGFPNFFMLLGPNTFLGHNSVIIMIEAQANYVIDCLERMRQKRLKAVDVRADVQLRFDQELQARMKGTIWQSGGCRSWYQDDSGRNVALWPGFIFSYRRRIRRTALSDYDVT